MSELVYHTISQADVSAIQSEFTITTTVDPPPVKSIVFGITFNLNGQQVPVTSDDIMNAATKGVDLALPGHVVIGSIADFTAWFDKRFGVKIPKPEDFPFPLDKIFDKIVSLVWTVTAAHVHVFPTAEDKPTAYTLMVSAAWAKGDGIPLIKDVLEIEGAVFGVTNEAPQPKQ